jgi:autotransporter-associated beta strand protein
VTNVNALGSGKSAVTINSGTLDMQTSLVVSNLSGGGLVINSSTFTNILSIQNNSTYGGVIGGKIGLLINAGTTRLNAANTYSNGTIIAANAGLAIGSGAANPGPGTVIASNNVTISQPATSPASTFAPPVNTVDGATVTFTAANTQDSWGNQFNGSALTTNIFSNGNMSIGGALSFSNFLGTVIITNGEVRWFNAAAGGDNTTFIFQGPSGGCFARDAVDIIHLGALFGNGVITGPTVSWPATYWIGGKGNDSEYSGAILGSNNIVKVGAGKLLLDGVTATVLASDSATFTNYQYASSLTNFGSFTVSNGVLAVASPNDFSAASGIFVASPTALLDATSMGYVTNFNDLNSQPTSAVITNGILTIVQTTVPGGSQTLGGNGPVKANGFVNMGTINPGFAGVAGTLTLSNTLQVMSNATNYFDLSDDPSGLTAPSDVLRVQGNIGLTGTSFIGLGAVNGTINPGTYSLIKYSGSLTNESGIVPSGPVSNFQLGGAIPATTRATLQVANAPGEVDLTVVSLNTSNLVWVGGVDPITSQTTNLWDVVTSYSWTNSGSGTAMQFFQLDNVSFTDLSTNQVVFLQGGLAPSSITVNSASNYIFGGPGNIIGNTAITKSGSGNLTLTNGANAFNGGITINSGIVKAGSESANNQSDLALGVGPVLVKTSGELRLGGGGTTLHFVTNAITVNGGIVKATDGVQHLTNSTVTIGASGGTLQTMFSTKNLVLDSPLNGAGNLVVSSGTNIAAGQVILNNPTNGLSGNVVIAMNGNLAFAGFASVSNSPSIDVQLGGILDFLGRSNLSWAVVSGQTLIGNGAVRGKFLIASAGSAIAPGIAGAIGTLTVTNSSSGTNWTVLTLSGTVNMDINRAAAQNSDRIVNVNGTNVFGGTLNVNNLGAALQAGDTFTLFTSAVNNGAFATVNLPILTGGLTWNNTLNSNGKISVVGSTILPTVSPGTTNFSLAGANIVLNGTNSQAGATYYLLSTTNVALPVSQWKTIATNVAAGTTYSFTGTNAVTAGQPQQFYLLSSTNYNP